MPKVKIKSNNTTTTPGGDFYTRTEKRVIKKGTPEKTEYKPESAETTAMAYQGRPPKTPEQQKATREESLRRNPGYAEQEKKAQAEKKDTFVYKKDPRDKSFKANLPYKAGTTTKTPATPDETKEVQQVSVTHKGDIQSSKGYKAKGDELEAKGYKNIPGTYNYEKPKKQVFVDREQLDQYLKDNPDALHSGAKIGERKEKEAKAVKEEEKKKKPVIKYKKQ